MLNEKTVKALEEEANKELEKRTKLGLNAEIVYIPIVIERDDKGNVGCITNFNGLIIPSEN